MAVSLSGCGSIPQHSFNMSGNVIRDEENLVAGGGRSRTSLCSAAPVHPCTMELAIDSVVQFHTAVLACIEFDF
jgi:hypothetical protein